MYKIEEIIKDYILVKGLTKGFAPLLSELIKLQNIDGKIIINAALKRDIGLTINSTVGSIDNMITKLVEKGVIIRLDRGMYVLSDEVKSINYEEKDDLQMKVTYKDNSKDITIGGINKWV